MNEWDSTMLLRPHQRDGNHRSLWIILRLSCQILLIAYYMNVPLVSWQRGVLAIGACAILGLNIVLFVRRDDVVWRQIERISIFIEIGIVAIFSIFLLALEPLGPGVLIVLPTLVTYTSLYRRDGWQWLMSAVPLVELIWMAYISALRHTEILSGAADISTWLIVILYALVIVTGMAFAGLLQAQHLERQKSQFAMTRVQEQAHQLRIVNNQANEYADKIYHLATAEERNRIAGEIHDTVAHRLTALIVQLQASRRMLTEEVDVDTSRENIVVCESLAREALDDVRTSVRAIRRNSSDEGITSLRRLVLQFTQLTGMEMIFEIDAGLESLPAHLMAVLYRVIQEALTNAQRHGRATRVNLYLRRKAALVELEAQDNGKGTPDLKLGFGLSAMQHRLQQHGGELSVTSKPGVGFRLLAQLPIWEGEVR